jgi:hypothetical protein
MADWVLPAGAQLTGLRQGQHVVAGVANRAEQATVFGREWLGFGLGEILKGRLSPVTTTTSARVLDAETFRQTTPRSGRGKASPG